jgi:hypothetical protein
MARRVSFAQRVGLCIDGLKYYERISHVSSEKRRRRDVRYRAIIQILRCCIQSFVDSKLGVLVSLDLRGGLGITNNHSSC